MDLRSRVLSALGWALGIKAVTQLINWAITLYVIRLLTPTDYGTMAIAMGFIAVLLPLGELGLGASIVQRKELDDLLLRKTFGFILIVSAIATALLFIAAGPIAVFFNDQQLDVILRTLSFSIIFMAFGVVPRALMIRELDFRRQSLVDMLGALTGSLITLALAVSGFGVWALVAGHLTMLIVQTVGLVRLTRFLPMPNFNFRGIGDVAAFGSWITAERLVWLIRGQIDVIVIGKLLGTQSVGLYSVAKQLATLPHAKVQGVINNVAFPAYGKALANGDDPAYYLLKYLRVSSVISFPIYFGISAVAPEFVPLLLTAKWASAVVPLQIIAMIAPIMAALATVAPYLHALGHVRISFGNQIIGITGLLIFLAIGAPWGLLGVSVGWALGFLATFFIILHRSCAATKLRQIDVLSTLGKAALPASIMYAAVLGLTELLSPSMSALVRLLILVGAGVIIHSIAVWTLSRAEVLELVDLFRKARP